MKTSLFLVVLAITLSVVFTACGVGNPRTLTLHTPEGDQIVKNFYESPSIKKWEGLFSIQCTMSDAPGDVHLNPLWQHKYGLDNNNQVIFYGDLNDDNWKVLVLNKQGEQILYKDYPYSETDAVAKKLLDNKKQELDGKRIELLLLWKGVKDQYSCTSP